ncbi:Nucleolin 2 [Morella rubra]|uniref:Nucleolin 2 n=1 Tax=Morella rubra TaxID=262757 RepID=A0A6A1V1L5_9ROSI|nr:Nucleolin 2 [Morella rubra]
MGKSNKKSTTKVDASPAVLPPSKSVKKGKREALDELEKQVSAKRQKKDEAVHQTVTKQKIEVKTHKKKKEETSSSDDSSSSDSEKEEKPAAKKLAVPAKNGTVGYPVKKGKEPSSSDSSDSDSEDDKVPKTKVTALSKKMPAAAAKNGALSHPKKENDSSDSSDSDTESDEEDVPATKGAVGSKRPLTAETKPVQGTKKVGRVEEESEEDTDESDEESEEEPSKTTSKNLKVASIGGKPRAKTVQVESDSDSSDDEDSEAEDDNKPSGKQVVKMPAQDMKKNNKPEEESDDEDTDESDEESEEEPSGTLNKKPKVASIGGKPSAKTAQEESNSDSSDDEESGDEDDNKPSGKQMAKKPAQETKKGSNIEEESEEDSDASDEESEEEPSRTPKKNGTEVEMLDAVPPKMKTDSKSAKQTPQTPATQQGQTTSKTLFVGNLSYNVERADVENFFKDAGEVADVRFASDPDGRFKGFGHVEFATAEAAQKAMELNGEDLLGRAVKLDFARERGAYTPQSGKESSNSFQRGGQTHTAYVRGFDKYLGIDEIKGALENHFGSCGEMTRVSVPKDYETGDVKGFAYIDFSNSDSLSNAIELNGSDLGGYSLMVEEAKPRDGAGSGRGGGGRNGSGRSGGRDSGGRFGGRRGGSRGSGGGGRFGGGGRGRGMPNRASFGASGKKTKFDDADD